MNLRAEIKPDLWDAISKQYESELYSNAIVEAIHYLSNVLRERANVDGDGASLVGQALGGDAPRLRINRFQTETEKNEQKGLEQILRGIYQGIRNPRSHEQFEDLQSTANSIILFIDYVLGIIGQAKEPFSLDEWVDRVFDYNFVASNRYAELLVAEVPPKKLLEALIILWRKKDVNSAKNLSYVVNELFRVIGDNQLGEFISLVSDEFKTVQQDIWIRISLQLFPPKLWPQIDELARLRIENKLILSITDGAYDTGVGLIDGSLGTWASDFAKYFILVSELADVLTDKLRSDDIVSQNYVAKYYFGDLPILLPLAIEHLPGNERYKKFKKEIYIEAIIKPILDLNNQIYYKRLYCHIFWIFLKIGKI